MKRLATLLVIVGSLIVPSLAGAHFIPKSQAISIATQTARSDCGKGITYFCYEFPLISTTPIAYQAGYHSWWVIFNYEEFRGYTRRVCQTNVRVEHTSVAESGKGC